MFFLIVYFFRQDSIGYDLILSSAFVFAITKIRFILRIYNIYI
ncbi:hypothetical protein HMPREF9445_00114 [Bacteroides clarus YIT 12056]|uniref:Uncharacterized protein n=1 Tax=Bacteroides clarus YIT 12056 TaxID=762984 RepID=A0ABN0CSZ5_9BACE|nr:hypothetical protein HMPREF9445_00114 [Bacteroides clarus YIT 12056]